MSCGTDVKLGVFTVGEIPAPLEYQFLDWSGVPIDLTAGFTAKFNWTRVGAAPAATANATVSSALLGKVQYTWTGTEFAAPGQYRAQFIVGNGTQRWFSDMIQWTTRSGVGNVPLI